MGTRSITHIKQMPSLGDEIICSFYRGFDGYLSGHGKELSEFLSGKRLVNGIGSSFEEGVDFNRAGQMAPYLITHLSKINSSGMEIIPTGSQEDHIDYIYTISYNEELNRFRIDVDSFSWFAGDEIPEESFDE